MINVASIARVLLVDPDRNRASLLLKHLQSQGFDTIRQESPLAVQPALATDSLDLLILQSNLPPLSAAELCLQLRGSGNTKPILALTDGSHYSERVAVLNAGADDALSSPYALEELNARLMALLRRSRMGANHIDGSMLSYGDLLVNTDTRQVSRAGQLIKLTVKEYDLLLCLLCHQQQVLRRQHILHLVWGDTWVGDDNLLDVYIRYLRKKLERPDLDPLIHTVRGVGFMLK